MLVDSVLYKLKPSLNYYRSFIEPSLAFIGPSRFHY
jgi:hypothetical protein